MGVELRPLGVTCNIQCQYCYQNPQRDAGHLGREYDLDAMKRAIEVEGGPFALFGGEPLLVAEEDLEHLWSWGFARYGHNAIQTNGTLVNDAHVRMFREYKVAVGISIDGPGELNDVRWHATPERTRESTVRTERAIERLCQEGMAPSLIVTLHRGNATEDRLPRLAAWLQTLEHLGVRSVRLHLLESESQDIRAKYALTTGENVAALLYFLARECDLGALRLDLFDDMRRMLLGQDASTSCVWNACDPYTTQAVRGVEGHGERSNCGRTNKDGIDFGKGERPGYERYLALYATPQWAGGCQGCRFFIMCKGHCPGTAIDGDWRNRTEHCEVWKAIYERLEAELTARGTRPLSSRADRPAVEQALLDRWSRGQAAYVAQMGAVPP
jgi:uncharacterized protein